MPISSGGFTMTATIDGKEWTADAMMPPVITGRIIGYYKNKYIGLHFIKSRLVPGKKIIFGPDEGVDLYIGNDCLYKDIKGEMEIIKAGEKIAESSFFFTGTCTGTHKKVEVSNGFFRIIIH